MVHLSESIKCNILLIGKTGTGKSSFANYLFDTDRFITGSGEPVTGWEDNFQYHHFYISDIAINVYDSVGLEPDNFSKWTHEMDIFLSERQPNNWGNIKTANDIIHTLFYVVNGAERIEETEIVTLENILNKYKLSASVIITNCDIAKEHELTAIESIVERYGLSSFRVCSISKKTRGGKKIEPFGKEPAIRQILSASYEKVGKELTISLLKEAIKSFNEVKKEAREKVDASELSVFNIANIDNIDIDFDSILPDFYDMTDFIPEEYKNYQRFLDGFNIEFQGQDIMNETIDSLTEILGEMDESNIKLVRKIQNMENDFENGDFFTKVGTIFKGLGMIVFIKKTLKDAIDEIFDMVLSELYIQLWRVESFKFDKIKDDSLKYSKNANSKVILKNWGIQFSKSKFDLTGILYGHKSLSDGSKLGNTSGIKDIILDYDNCEIIFKTLNTHYSCSFDEYTSKYLNECENRWTKGSASPKIFDDIIEQMLDKNPKLYDVLMSGMVDSMVGDLKKQFDADKNITINLNDVFLQNFDNNNNDSMKTLQKHIGNDIIFTGTWAKVQNERQLRTDELLPGEISAMIYEIGGYIIRSAERVYKRLEDFTEIPADNDAVKLAKESKKSIFGMMDIRNEKIRVTNEISAMRRNALDSLTDSFIIICQASQGMSWYESVNFICTLLTSPSLPSEKELLFINNHYMGDSFSSETWYRLDAYGIVKSYKIHPFDSDSLIATWDISSEEKAELHEPNHEQYCDNCPYKQCIIKLPEEPCTRCKNGEYKIYKKMLYDVHGEGEEVLLDAGDVMWYMKNLMAGMKNSMDDIMGFYDI